MKKQNKRLVCFDLIRVFSCLCVIIAHFNASMSGWTGSALLYANSIIPSNYLGGRVYIGDIGVSLFFLLSGAAQMLSYREERVFSYYKRRFVSLFPMFWMAYVIASVVDFLLYKGMPAIPLWRYAFSFVGMDGYLSDIGLLGLSAYKIGEWFLGCILLLFVLFPLLYRGVKKLPVVTILLALAVYVPFEFHPYIGRYSFIGAEFFMRIPEIIFGMLFVKYRLWENKKLLIATGASAAAFAAAMLFGSGLSRLSLTILTCVLLFLVLVWVSKAIKWASCCRALAGLAGLTYPVFLVHHFLIDKLVIGFPLDRMSRTDIVMMFLVFLLLSGLFAWVLKKAAGKWTRTGLFSGKPATVLWGLVLAGVIALPILSVAAYAIAPEAPPQMTEPAPAVFEAQDYDAEIVAHDSPGKVTPGDSYVISITAKNTGAAPWSEAGQIRLCVWQDGADWGYRLMLPEGVEVEPGEEYTFRLEGFGVAPGVESTYLEYQMVQEGVQYFGEKERADIAVVDPSDGSFAATEPPETTDASAGSNKPEEADAPAAEETAEPVPLEGLDAKILSHTTPETVNRLGLYTIDIVVENTGEVAWSEEKQIRLAILQDGIDYGYRLFLSEGTKVAPGEQYIFQLVGFGAPPSGRATSLEYGMVQGGDSFFGEKTKADITIVD